MNNKSKKLKYKIQKIHSALDLLNKELSHIIHDRSDLFLSQDVHDIFLEANHNLNMIHIERYLLFWKGKEYYSNLLMNILQNKCHSFLSKYPSGFIAYAWFDMILAQFRFSFISLNHQRLPFGTEDTITIVHEQNIKFFINNYLEYIAKGFEAMTNEEYDALDNEVLEKDFVHVFSKVMIEK